MQGSVASLQGCLEHSLNCRKATQLHYCVYNVCPFKTFIDLNERNSIKFNLALFIVELFHYPPNDKLAFEKLYLIYSKNAAKLNKDKN